MLEDGGIITTDDTIPEAMFRRTKIDDVCGIEERVVLGEVWIWIPVF